MEFPEPTIDIVSAVRSLVPDEVVQLIAARQVAVGLDEGALAIRLRAFLAQAWEEGRWAKPGACMNPYGEPAAHPAPNSDQQGFPGVRLLRLRTAAQAALAWVENMAPTVRRTALANQLRDALGGK